MGTFFRGMGEGKPAQSGTYAYDAKSRKLVLVSTEVPNLAGVTSIMGETVSCEPGGETLPLEKPVFVRDAAEKRRELKKRGLMPSPKNVPQKTQKEREREVAAKMPSFSEFFYKQHGTTLEESGAKIGVKRADGSIEGMT